MSSTRDEVLAALDAVAVALGPELNRVVFVGATVCALYSNDPIRPTNDVDVIVTSSLPEYYQLIERLRAVGFQESREEGAPVCRYELRGIVVDVMPTDAALLGFSNRHYLRAFEEAATYRLPSGRTVRAITPAFFIATKLEAFKSRGQGDYRSKDIEDIVLLLAARPDLIEEIARTDSPLHEELRVDLARLIKDEDFEDAFFGSFRGDDASQNAADQLLRKLDGALHGGTTRTA